MGRGLARLTQRNSQWIYSIGFGTNSLRARAANSRKRNSPGARLNDSTSTAAAHVATAAVTVRCGFLFAENHFNLLKRFAFGLRYETVHECYAENGDDGEQREIHVNSVRVGDGLVDLQRHQRRDGHDQLRDAVGLRPFVGREVLAHDRGHQWHDPCVGEEHSAGQRGQHQQLVAAAVQAVRGGRVADTTADARDEQQRTPAEPVDDHGGQQVTGQRHKT